MTSEIILSTLNASFHHSSFGLRYLKANLGEALFPRCLIKEYTIHKKPEEIAIELLELNPRIIGFGVYIWNTDQTLETIKAIKLRSPKTILVLGGPEVSHESHQQEIVKLADYTICGEGDFLFRRFCEDILFHQIHPKDKIIKSDLPLIQDIRMPYFLYSDEDIKNRTIYVEASRGCPFKCEYCLSSLDKAVRNFPIDSFISEMEGLYQRGVRQFKFIDRTFNLSPSISQKILQYFLSKPEGLFLHFEMVPDRLPDELKKLIEQFPPGSLQFEIGVQTWNETVAQLVSRRQDYSKVEENLKYLKRKTHVHSHVDLIGGLPGETLESFAQGFDRLAALEPDEIQVGLLKRLKGTPIIRHDKNWEMNYSTTPPFQIISTKTMSTNEIQKFSQFAKFWDLIANRGQFKLTCELIKAKCLENNRSLFSFYWEMTDFLIHYHGKTYAIHLNKLFESLAQYLKSQFKESQETLLKDYHRSERYYTPEFLRFEGSEEIVKRLTSSKSHAKSSMKRQNHHLH